ncbi:MAG TPA: hypothetical protein VN040_02710 [Pseudosphingobacterium sp.]|nr:hypothetical protein [Pseudosphingobacterium sp.]
MKTIPLFFTFAFFATTIFAQSQTRSYQCTIDLLNTQDDKVTVSCSPPKNNLKQGKFIIPKMVPGYYDAMNFGQYISDFIALDKTGKEIRTERLDKNSWMVHDLKNVVNISYQVVDGWDSLQQNTQGAKSAASTFIKDSVFVINYNSLVGYFQEMNDLSYKINVKKNKGFYPSSALNYIHKNDTIDVFSVKSYRELVDAPVLYCVPDTTWIKVGNAEVLVSFYNKEQRHYSKKIANELEIILKNQQAYLGGKLPVDKYAFLIYYEPSKEQGFMGDGLEHAQSTVCLYNSSNINYLTHALNAVASHEFFHIVTPLNIHSREIENYDFLNPTLSKHLWLYEGMTEYATIHMPIKQKKIGLEEFTRKIEEKINGMEGFDNKLSFTELSKNAVERQDQYMNFYQKGALLGLCLDIKLRELSDGKMGTQELMQQLMKKYGKGKYFNDDVLFDKITAMTSPEIRAFFSDYIEGGDPIPLKECLEKAGFEYDEIAKTINPINNPNTRQLALRKAWINQ